MKIGVIGAGRLGICFALLCEAAGHPVLVSDVREDYGVGFYTMYGDGGVDIAPIADLYKTEVRELGGYLGVMNEIIDATPTDGLWDDGRSDEDQIGATYAELEEAMENGTGKAVDILYKFNRQNKHKMEPIPTFEL